MKLQEVMQRGLFYLDGGTGSCLQAQGLAPGEAPELWNLTHPQDITALHRAYYEAGSHAVCANTFGVNGLKYTGENGVPGVQELVNAAMACAKKAREEAVGGQADKFIALDVGPLGRLLAPLGDVPFERAVALFADVIRAGAAAGADFVLIETMNDSYETKAAVLAARECCSLPLFVSNVYDAGGKLMSGADPEAMTAMLEGLGVTALGMNCSLGPQQMQALLPRFAAAAGVPVLAKPNAGLPREENGRAVYDVTSAQFAADMRQMALGGARILGGCCGTTPEYIRALVQATCDVTPAALVQKRRSVVSSYTHAVTLGETPVLIGERINPTGKKRFKEALRAHDISYVLREGITQQEQGAHVLDVNVGLPELDEPAMLAECVRELQSVCDAPLQLDTANPVAMERALRLYNGKALVNSVSGSEKSMNAIFPLVKKYGGVVVCLTLDEQGIPATAEARFAVAQNIVRCAAQFGLGVEDLLFDPLALTVSSEPGAARVTLDTIALLKTRLGAHCSLGVSNISFGLPERPVLTATFFAMALACGLDAAIMNPACTEMQKVYHSYLALTGQDANCAGYIAFASALPHESAVGAAPVSVSQQAGHSLQDAIEHGLAEEAAALARNALQTQDALDLINGQIVPALDVVGRGFEAKTVFLPQLLMSAEAAKAAFEEAKRTMPAAQTSGPAVLLATVQGDIHDIGKNIVKALLENYGYRVIDLGRDVAPQAVAAAAVQQDVRLVGLSALMTTTVPAMEETIALLHRQVPACRVVVGGAVLTQRYADAIKADHYAQNAMETVRYAGQVLRGE